MQNIRKVLLPLQERKGNLYHSDSIQPQHATFEGRGWSATVHKNSFPVLNCLWSFSYYHKNTVLTHPSLQYCLEKVLWKWARLINKSPDHQRLLSLQLPSLQPWRSDPRTLLMVRQSSVDEHRIPPSFLNSQSTGLITLPQILMP